MKTSAIPLKDLLAKATPGPWHYTGHGWVQRTVVPFTPIAAFNFNAHEPANAQLIARLSPDVMTAVLEALTAAQQVGEIRFKTCVLSAQVSDQLDHALALLNGNHPTAPSGAGNLR